MKLIIDLLFACLSVLLCWAAFVLPLSQDRAWWRMFAVYLLVLVAYLIYRA